MGWSIRSTWRRWDQYIHAPGTLNKALYGAYDGDAVWKRYFAEIREAHPAGSAKCLTESRRSAQRVHDVPIGPEEARRLEGHERAARETHGCLAEVNDELEHGQLPPAQSYTA
jgi:hypothetical protein